MAAVRNATADEVIAIDGKTMRRSHNKGKRQSAIHLVSAWATRNRLTLGQIKVDEKSNGITAVPAHWGIENSLHRVLDVVFREDDSRVRIRNAAENLALIGKITHNLLQQETTLKRGIKTKRLVASWDRNYLLKVIGLIPFDP